MSTEHWWNDTNRKKSEVRWNKSPFGVTLSKNPLQTALEPTRGLSSDIQRLNAWFMHGIIQGGIKTVQKVALKSEHGEPLGDLIFSKYCWRLRSSKHDAVWPGDDLPAALWNIAT
jgi:hypothetical protein